MSQEAPPGPCAPAFRRVTPIADAESTAPEHSLVDHGRPTDAERSGTRHVQLTERHVRIHIETVVGKLRDQLLRGQEALRLARELREDERLPWHRRQRPAAGCSAKT